MIIEDETQKEQMQYEVDKSHEYTDAIGEVRNILRQEAPSKDDIAHVIDMISIVPGEVYSLVDQTVNADLKRLLVNCQGNSPDVACNPACGFRTDLKCPYDTFYYVQSPEKGKPPLTRMNSSGSKTAYVYGDKQLTAEHKAALRQAGYKSYQQFRIKDGVPIPFGSLASLRSAGNVQTSIVVVIITIMFLLLLCVAAYYLL